MKKKLMSTALAIALSVMMCACGAREPTTSNTPSGEGTTETTAASDVNNPTASASETSDGKDTDANTTDTAQAGASVEAAEAPAVEKNGEVIILCTSDVHCGVNQGFGYAGLAQVRQSLEDQGYTTILVDDGDSIQGEAIGTLTEGEAIIRLMNDVGYDIVIPGNHEFDYGTDQFLRLTEKANFKYISCNINKRGELVFDPYAIVDVCGIKIGFVGITTPETLNSSNPSNFQDESGEMVYGFCENQDGTALYEAVQKAVDDVRAEGVDYVYVLAHLGLEETAEPWTYYDVISNTNGIDVFLDGHSHDVEQVVMKNKDGKNVTRCAVGTKMHCIGYSRITSEGIQDTNIWSWPNDIDAATLMNIDNEVNTIVNDEIAALQDVLNKKVCDLPFDLVDRDPYYKDNSGNLIRLVRQSETNLGDISADSMRWATGADIALLNGGALRASIKKGEVTYGDIIAVFPFSNDICIIEATGQQILDALEWGSRAVPGETGAFLHPSGLTYEIDSTIETPCKANEQGMMSEISGKRRVSNVKVGDEPIDPAKVYTVTGIGFTLLKNGDGFTSFDGCKVISSEFELDNVIMINYIKEIIGTDKEADYSEPLGQGRIIIHE